MNHLLRVVLLLVVLTRTSAFTVVLTTQRRRLTPASSPVLHMSSSEATETPQPVLKCPNCDLCDGSGRYVSRYYSQDIFLNGMLNPEPFTLYYVCTELQVESGPSCRGYPSRPTGLVQTSSNEEETINERDKDWMRLPLDETRRFRKWNDDKGGECEGNEGSELLCERVEETSLRRYDLTNKSLTVHVQLIQCRWSWRAVVHVSTK